MAAKKLVSLKKIEVNQHLGINSPNAAFVHHSKFYNEYKDKLLGYYPVLKKEGLTENNYKKRFHHLLCWEEQEHDKQLAQR